MVKPQDFLAEVMRLHGRPYLWNGKGPGVDCSGVVTVAYREAGGPDWTRTHWTDRLWMELPKVVGKPAPADLLLYGGSAPNDVDHVMVHLGDGVLIGACGGGRWCTSVELARSRDARVRLVQLDRYRLNDFRGVRRLPLESP